MSKPLEMPIHPKLKWPSRGSEIEPYRKQWKAENALRLSKRFTDAELAAEVQSASAEIYRAKAFHDDTIPAVQRFMTFRRFATTPGHGEVKE